MDVECDVLIAMLFMGALDVDARMHKRMMKEIAMTHDQLVQFAASKAGISTIQNMGIGGGWLVKINKQTCWHYAYGTEQDALENSIDLTSPGLMLKGMKVLCRSGCKWDATAYKWEMWKTGYPTSYAIQRFIHIEDTPLTFWECWYKLEKGD